MTQSIDGSNILRTKLYRPRSSGAWVDRPRLLDRLNAGRQRPLTLVAAPAGYGKTALISNWLEATDCPHAWVSLDEDDDDLVQFLTYLLAAVETMFPGAISETQALLRTTSLPPQSVLFRSLLNELDRVDRAFILVMDDCHYIHETAVHKLLDELTAHPPRPMHLVLISRKDMPISLARYRARGQVTEVRTADLRFTREEAAVFVEQEIGTPVGESAVTALHRRVEGWVTGLRLLILSLRHRGRIDLNVGSLDGNAAYVAEYLLTEVLHSLPQATQDCLLNTAILDRFCAPLCQAVSQSSAQAATEPESETESGGLTGQEFVEWLEEYDPFVVRLDDSGEWYRYHHLFRELLQNRLGQQRGPDGVAVLHSQASHWFAQNGLIDEALVHALKADNTAAAVNLVAEHRHDLMSREQWHRLARWMRIIPSQVADQEPELLMSKAWIHYNRSQRPVMVAVLERIQSLLDQGSLDAAAASLYQAEIDVMRCDQALASADVEQLVTHADRALSVIPHEWAGIRSHALIYRIYANQLVGDSDRAYQMVQDVLATDTSRSAVFQGRLMMALCFVQWANADLSALRQTATRYLKLGQEQNLPESESYARFFLGCLFYHRNDLVKAANILVPAVAKRNVARATGAIDSACILALTYQALNQPKRARETAEATEAFLLEWQSQELLLMVEALHAELLLRQGRMAEAAQWAQGFCINPSFMLHLFWIPHLIQPKILLAQDTAASRDRAAQVLGQLRKLAESTHNTRVLMGVLALQALLDDAQGDEPSALEKLGHAVDLAEPGGWIRLFVDLGPPMAGLLERLRDRGVAPGTIARILAAFPDRATDLAEPLTPREVEVLALLAQDLSNKEIASELVLETSSVKQYTHRIYHKLGVKNRQKAVKAARDLGMLSAE